ncbi:MAG: LysR family transcriptional regulator [Sporolactobacillus sp.]|jgi:LysR family transcriptional activator of glutamate synthase operon|nr:LysR family transcriptional regulator [Sporolactobacillus sp.]MCI1882273.1 LysR family transcriptional regulator [Sporolactobacillus sp.]
MELRQIEYFIEAAKREHITKAAAALHVAQSAVSRQIAMLEDELGVSLFTRQGRNIQLTPAGKLFLEHAERGLAEFEKAELKIKERLNPESGLIRLGLSTGLPIHTLPILLENFHRMHPGIGFRLHQGTVPYLIRLIDKGQINLAFASPVPLRHNAVTGNILYSERMLLLLPKRHRYAGGGPVPLGKLKNERFITFCGKFSLQELFRDACRQAGFDPIIVFEGEDMATMNDLVAAGFGIALMPENAVADHLPSEVTTAVLTAPEVSRSVGIIRPKRRELAPSELLFFRYIDQFYDRLYQFGK